MEFEKYDYVFTCRCGYKVGFNPTEEEKKDLNKYFKEKNIHLYYSEINEAIFCQCTTRLFKREYLCEWVID